MHGLCASLWSTWPLKDCRGEDLLRMTRRPTINERAEDINNFGCPVPDGHERFYKL